jgi:RNA polymerase sigma factor (sigma-70 family)
MVIIDAYGDALRRYLTRRLPNKESAEDILQETYLRLIRAAQDICIRSPQAYLFRIASNIIYELAQDVRRSPITFDSSLVEHRDQQDLDSNATELLDRLDTHQQIKAILAKLRPLDAAILVYRHYAGLSITEIAETLEISAHTAKKYLHRSISTCRRCINASAKRS